MYQRGLSLQILSEFSNHNGFDGVILGIPQTSYHLEFTFNQNEEFIAGPINTESAMVFYVANIKQFDAYCSNMINAGFKTITALNPYWEIYGKSFVDFDNNIVIISHKNGEM